MVAENVIKMNGRWYKAGEEVPEGKLGQESMSFPESTFGYKKTDINRMSTADLRELAKKHGVSNADDMTGQDLKDYFISEFNL